MDPIAQARDLLPWWVPYLSCVVWIVFTYTVGTLFIALGTALNLRALAKIPAELHWAERARRVWPIRTGVGGFVVLAPAVFGGLSFLVPSRLAPRGLWIATLTICVLLVLPALRMADRTLTRRLWPDRPLLAPAEKRRARLFAAVALYPHLYLSGIALLLLPRELNVWAVIASVLYLTLLIAAAFGGGIDILAHLRWVTPIDLAGDSKLAQAVSDAAERTHITPREVYAIPMARVNAFAFPLRRTLVFSKSATQVLSTAHVSAIAAHELGHIGESRPQAFARSMVVVVLAPIVLAKPFIGVVGYSAFVGGFLLTVFLSLVLRRIARRHEDRADAVAAGHEHAEDHGTYARALEQVYEHNLLPAVMRGKRPHGHLYDRMRAAGLEPDFPRPEPPPRGVARAASVFATVLLFVVVAVLLQLPDKVVPVDRPELRLAFRTHFEQEDLAVIAARHEYAGDLENAVILIEAARTIAPDDPWVATDSVRLLARVDRCTEAESLLSALRTQSWDASDDALLDCRERAADYFRYCTRDNSGTVPPL